MRRERQDWLVREVITIADVLCGRLRRKYLIVSHRWELPGLPDEKGEQLKALRDFVILHEEIEFVWIE